jgi:hypothetical protein
MRERKEASDEFGKRGRGSEVRKGRIRQIPGYGETGLATTTPRAMRTQRRSFRRASHGRAARGRSDLPRGAVGERPREEQLGWRRGRAPAKTTEWSHGRRQLTVFVRSRIGRGEKFVIESGGAENGNLAIGDLTYAIRS